MSERTTQAFKDMCWAKLEHRKGLVHGPETNPPHYVIKSYQYQIEKAMEPQFRELFEPGHTAALLEEHLNLYWRDQHGPYRKVKPEVVTTPNGFVVNLGDFQIAEYSNVIPR